MIEIKDLVKDYGDLRAVNSIDLKINDGEILGFLGPNGAGKSTTFKVLTGYLQPTSGNIFVGDKNIKEHSLEIRKMIGYLPENNPLYVEMTVYDYLKFVADIREITDFKKRLKEVISQCGLQGVVHKPINTLSKGYRQRVGIAQAILHDPKILILDEPTSGLDPNQIAEIRELIIQLGKEKTLIISSHIMQEVQAVCDRIVIINRGEIVADGKTSELTENIDNIDKVFIELKNAEVDEVLGLKDNIPEITNINCATKDENLQVEIQYLAKNDIRENIYLQVKKENWILLEMHRKHASLEEIFRNLTSNGGNK
jgi:ABC-2 type transport system ATP-binding protein